jgi:hypothetical protein
VAGLALGCVPISVHPIYNEQTEVVLPELTGKWLELGGTEGINIESDTVAGGYVLTFMEEDSVVSVMEAHLTKIDGRLFMDLSPGDLPQELDDFFQEHVIAVHSFYSLDLTDSTLRVNTFDESWLRDYLEESPAEIAHGLVDDRSLFTAPTEQVRQFITSHFDDEGALGEPEDYRRR